MQAYAALVDDDALRLRFLPPILKEFATARSHLEDLFGGSLESQRPILSRSIGLRAPALRPLHLQQIRLLKEWRQARQQRDDAAAVERLPDLLLIVNAIASGLGTTG
jgi:phosphoenolpyruvate carboxylase